MSDEGTTDVTTGAGAAPVEQGSESLGAVAALMTERHRFEGWLAALDARRDATPPHVFTRVHADYTARLASVVERLAAHAEGLRVELAALSDQLAAIEAEQQQARDERAEGELRAHVGELSPEAWEEAEMASDIALEELARRRGAVERQLGQTRELLAEAERPAGRAGSSELTSDEGEGAMHVPSASAPSAPGAEAPPLVDAGGEVMEVSASVIAAEQQLIDGGAPRFGDLTLMPSAVVTPIGGVDAAPADRPDEAVRRDSFSLRAQGDDIVKLDDEGPGLDGSAPEVGRGTEPPPSTVVLQSKPADASKTLKCSECGSLNYPTEWYCERCGAELASL